MEEASASGGGGRFILLPRASGAVEGHSATAARAGERPNRRAFDLALVTAAGAALYGVLFLLKSYSGAAVPDSVHVAIPFLLLPFLFYRVRGQSPEWGAIDRSFAFSVAVYMPFAAWLLLAAPNAPQYFLPIAAAWSAAPSAVFWAADTFFHVGAVDYFTKRVVQHEAEPIFGPRAAQGIQLAAWSAGHVLEWTWLRFILGDIGAAAFLVMSGFGTGLAYRRWRNVIGLMVGHFLVNVFAGLAAVALLGG